MYKPADTKPELLSNPNSSPNSASSSEASGEMECLLPRFKENNPENHKILCSALEKKVPWQKEIIPDVVSTILECRSGKRNHNKSKMNKKMDREEAWLFFLGVDFEGKEKISKELARVVFGSQDDFITISLNSFSCSTRDDSGEEVSNKRPRDEHGRSYVERFGEAVQENPSRVFFMEDVDQVEYHSQKGLKKAIENGSLTLPDGETVLLKDAIVIFSCDSFSSVSKASSPPPIGQRINNVDNNIIINEKKEQQNGENLEEIKRPCVAPLDLNIATEEDNGDDQNHQFSDKIGIVDLVDKQVMFKVQVV